ncbi:arachidonate 15-lipoxygenase [Nannocystis exedens]|uniref:Arachidonate 15-lipoxygenase n=1 Tax=Nannocystis exedens TaxID=54 RepID=A0A1I2IKI4_9BACT|nr:lipoxygenase family protein [Nannocystis exedens]PCC73658.1 Linoleate 9/13-lipoxygenase precursor [Nannocystis exedens]SFF41031.1 arachidonate 15-lipoxygenase [Nannocystis exedens]
MNYVPIGLPQRARDPEARRERLARSRGEYEYEPRDPETHWLYPVPVAKRFPIREWYSPGWVLRLLPVLVPSLARRALQTGLGRAAETIGLVRGADRFRLLSLGVTRPAWVDETDALDDAFARQRLDGPCPVLLERVRDPARLAQLFASGEALARAHAPELAAGRLFAVEYSLLQRALPLRRPRDSRWRARYMAAPRVLFQQHGERGGLCELRPIAIQLDGPDAPPPNPLYRPGDGAAWYMAKLHAQAAEMSVHIFGSHLGQVHTVIEAFAMATPRCLAPEHPIHVLLEPHLRWTLQVNADGNALLRDTSSHFGTIYGGSLADMRAVLIAARSEVTFLDLELERDLARRGVAEAPLDYPFRDDARPWMTAIRRFVAAYVELFYGGDADVTGDHELQGWFLELLSPDGGDLRSLTASGRLGTREELVEVLTQVLFTAGPRHAALHYGQPDFYSLIEGFPAAIYQPPPREGAPASFDALLPPLAPAATQVHYSAIAVHRASRFGDYASSRLGKLLQARAAVQRLQRDLAAIEAELDERNRRRPRPYRYLLPSLVPASVHF